MSSAPVPINELSWRLFEPNERWGWEYVMPPPPQQIADPEPTWVEPGPPSVREAQHEFDTKWAVAKTRARWFAIVIVPLLLWGGSNVAVGDARGVPIILCAILLAGVWSWPALWAYHKRAQVQQAAVMQHYYAVEHWRYRAAEQARNEEWRVETAFRWYPLRPQAAPSRVDVFGGTSDGRASLITTLGSGLLAAGQSVLVLDFSQEAISGGLAVLAGLRGLTVRQHELPADLSALDLFHGLGAEDMAELLTEAAHAGRQSSDSMPLRAVAADLIDTVAQRLTGPITFQRLVAGLQLLQRLDESHQRGTLLPEEVQRITAAIDTVAKTDLVQNELGFLCSVFEQLARVERETKGSSAAREDLRIQPGLTIMSTAGRNERRKRLADSVTFHSVLHHLRAQTGQARPDLLVVAGADHMGKESLEALARHARRSRVRLVYLLEHLRGDVTHLLGGADSAVVFMRLGNTEEAAAAANYIGRGHKFVLSQLTVGIGRTLTEGMGDSSGGSSNQSLTEGRSLNLTYGESSGRNWAGWFSPNNSTSTGTSFSRAEGASSSRSTSLGTTWQQTKNWSTSDATNAGETTARVYEYTVEPTTLQALPPTAFILVDTGPGGRRLASGDCNPGIVALGKVASNVRNLASSETPPPPPLFIQHEQYMR